MPSQADSEPMVRVAWDLIRDTVVIAEGLDERSGAVSRPGSKGDYDGDIIRPGR